MKYFLAFLYLSTFCSCNNNAVSKPDNLIDEDQMVAIFYDLAILESVKTQIPESDQKFKGKPDAYVYKKYKIDSLQFAKSNQYYAADISRYKKIFDNVKEKIKSENDKLLEPINNDDDE